MSGKDEYWINKETFIAGVIDGILIDDGKLFIFGYRGRRCVVKRTTLPTEITFHNGYVSVLPQNEGIHYNDVMGLIRADEPTFSGRLCSRTPELRDYYFIGFDSAHVWNDEEPHTKTFESVFERTKAFADDMIEGGI